MSKRGQRVYATTSRAVQALTQRFPGRDALAPAAQRAAQCDLCPRSLERGLRREEYIDCLLQQRERLAGGGDRACHTQRHTDRAATAEHPRGLQLGGGQTASLFGISEAVQGQG